MLRRIFAEKLIFAGSEKERGVLLAENRRIADFKLAAVLKDICYESWTTEPTKAQKTARSLASLFKINPQNRILAVSHWVAGISDLAGGKLESAVRRLDQSAEIFRSIGFEHEAAKTQVAKLAGLAMLGRYAEAVESGTKALQIFEKYGDELAAGKIEMNLGNIVARREHHREAEQFYLAARRRYRKLGENGWLTMAENGLALTYVALNDFRRAEKFYAQALKRAQTEKMLLTEAEIEASIGNLSFFRGHFDRALKFLENSRRKYEKLRMPHQIAIAELEIADIYLELNLADEAFEIYEKTVESLRKLKLLDAEARARANFGKVALLKNQFALAKKQLKISARLYESEGGSSGAATVKLHEAALEMTRRRFSSALKIILTAEKLLENGENTRLKIYSNWLRGETLRNLKLRRAAAEILTETYDRAVKNEQKNLAQACLNSLGNLALDENEVKKAEKYFRKSVRIIEKLRAPLPAEEFRIAFLADKLNAYHSLAAIHLRRNEIVKAFSAIESARVRSLSENFSLTRKETAASPQILGEIGDLREELNWFYARLNRGGDQSEAAAWQIEARTREKRLAVLSRQLESTNDGFNFNRGERTKLNLKLLREQLGADQIMIEFVNFQGAFSAFVVTDKKISFVGELAAETEIRELLKKLQFQFGALRYGVKRVGRFAGELKKKTDLQLAGLYEKLLKPLAKLIGGRNLIVVPSGILNYVPFHALYDGTRYEIEKREIICTPSAAVWQYLREKPIGSLCNALLVGYADERIPLVNREIDALASIFKSSQIFAGDAATVENYKLQAPHFDVLHLACHGSFRPDNPLFSSLHLADGSLTVHDIRAQKLKAELVTLSACETGLNSVLAGEEIIGLARGFLAAGARSLILSLWTVNDETTGELMREFYQNVQRGMSFSASLRFSQIKFIERGSHPYFWSSFFLLGK